MFALFILSILGQHPVVAEPLWADVGSERALFLVTQPDAAESAAVRQNDDLASKRGSVPPPTAGWRLASRLIVRTADRELLAMLAGELAGASVAPLGTLNDFHVVEAGSVRAALQLREALAPIFGEAETYLDAARPLTGRGLPADPGFPQQWHLYNTVTPIADANVRGAWDAGWTGQGVVIGVVDDGVYETHPDLAPNFNASGSQVDLPSDHGTSCAGVAAAAANNGLGGVGAAYGAQWSEMHYGFASQNATAFGFANDVNDIKTNSWGPFDDNTLKHMTSAERAALEDAALNGRGGLGVVFFWAAGNGGTLDRMDYDPYASSRFTMAIGAVTDGDVQAAYSESGSALFCAAQSSGGVNDIYTTDGPNLYTADFGGTSAACPLAAGVGALILSANPALTWRDVQHILADSARQCDAGDADWVVNSSGRTVNYAYGFGALDATAAVNRALTWTSLGAQQTQDSGAQAVNAAIPDNNSAGVVRSVTVATSMIVETVELVMNVDHNFVGDLQIELTSPGGTVSLLTKKRQDSQDDLVGYLLTTFRCWGEDSAGIWTVKVADLANGTTGTWTDFTLRVHGWDGSGGSGDSVLTSGTIMAGATATLHLAQAVPNAATWLAASTTGAGSTYVPQLGVTVALSAPFPLAGPTSADALGTACWNLPVPVSAAGMSYWLQAAQAGKVSNVLAGVVQ
jgi:subtilisin-like proprotein convertase family protein